MYGEELNGVSKQRTVRINLWPVCTIIKVPQKRFSSGAQEIKIIKRLEWCLDYRVVVAVPMDKLYIL